MSNPTFVNVLNDPDYWGDPRSSRYSINMLIGTWIFTILCVTFVAFLVVILHWHTNTNRHQIEQQRTCLKAGGQWIKGDCINNLIQLRD